MAEIFISYSHKDSGYAHRLAEELRSRQIEVWIDDRIDYGDQWPRVIQENLAACRIFIVLMSTKSFNSMWVQNEVSYAQVNKKPIFPLLLEGEVWLSLSAMQYVDVQTGEMPPEKFFVRLQRELNKPITRPIKRQSMKNFSRRRILIYLFAALLFLVVVPGLCLYQILGPVALLDPKSMEMTTNASTEETATQRPTTEIPATEAIIVLPPTEIPTATPIYTSGLITFITKKEEGESLYVLERDGSQRALLEEPGISGIKILAVSAHSGNPPAPRYLVVGYWKNDLLNVVVVNTLDSSAITISHGADDVKASYLMDGRLLVEVKGNNTAMYSLYEADGSAPKTIYTTVLSLPTSTPTLTPGGSP